MAASLSELSTYLGEKLPGRVKDAVLAYGELGISVEPGDLIDVVTFLRDDPRCQFIIDLEEKGIVLPHRPAGVGIDNTLWLRRDEGA